MKKRKEKKYTLTINEEQASVLTIALEMFIRGGINQYKTMMEQVLFQEPGGWEKVSLIEPLCDEMHQIVTKNKEYPHGMPANMSYGIHSLEISDRFRVAYDLRQVIEHRLAWDRNPKGEWTCQYDRPMRSSRQPLAQIEKKSNEKV